MTKKKKYFIIFILLVLFLIPRLGIIYYRSVNNINKADILLYSLYSFDYTVASLTNQNFYELNYKNQQQRLKVINKQKGLRDNKHSFGYFEYPPLALQWIVLPGQIMTKFIDFSKKKNPVDAYISYYCFAYRIQSLIAEFIILLIFLILTFKRNFVFRRVIFGIVYFSIVSLCLSLLIYERMDIFLALLIYVSICFLLYLRSCWLSYFFIAFAVCFKLIPLFFVPLFIFYTIDIEYKRKVISILIEFGKRLFLFLLFCLLSTLPFVFIYGVNSLRFIVYHFKRGIQIESVYGNILLIFCKLLHVKNYIYFDYGSFNIRNILGLNQCCLNIAMVILMLVIYCSFIGVEEKFSYKEFPKKLFFISNIFAVAIIFLVFSKVLSPQYFIWCIPITLFEIMFSKNLYCNIKLWVFFACTFITGIIALRYSILLMGTPLGIFLLSVRNFLLLVLCVAYLIDIYTIRKSIINGNWNKLMKD